MGSGRSSSLLTQQVVVYDKAGEPAKVYATCYSDDQCRSVIKQCVRRHGFKNVRALPAAERSPQ